MKHISLKPISFLMTIAGAVLLASPAKADPGLGTEHWEGFYGGLHINAFGGTQTAKRGAGVSDYKKDSVSGMIGVHAGYMFDTSSAWKWGVEADISLGGEKEKETDTILGDIKRGGTFVSTARLRAGYAWKRAFFYGTAGFALTDHAIKPRSNKDTDLSLGLAIGLGAEYAFNDKWSARAEAIGYSFGEPKFSFNGSKRKTGLEYGSLRIGLSRKF